MVSARTIQLTTVHKSFRGVRKFFNAETPRGEVATDSSSFSSSVCPFEDDDDENEDEKPAELQVIAIPA